MDFVSRSSFSLLPNELVREAILAGIPSQPYPDDRDNFPAARYRARGLVRLARVSKEWKDICIPLLYQEAIFELSREGEKERLALFWTRIDLDPSLGRHVRRLLWTQDLNQFAHGMTTIFLARAHFFPSIQSVSALSILTPTPPLSSTNNNPPLPLSPPHPALPNLRSLRILSWEAEPQQPPSPEWYRQRCLLSFNALGSLSALETIHLSFANIEFPNWFLSELQTKKTALPHSSSSLKRLDLFGPFLEIDDDDPYLPFHSLLRHTGPTLQTLHLNNDDTSDRFHVFPIPPENLLPLCPNLLWLSLHDSAAVQFVLERGGHAKLERIWIGHSATVLNSEEDVRNLRAIVKVVVAGLLARPLVDEEDERSDASRATRFPKLREVGFWGLDFRRGRHRIRARRVGGKKEDWKWKEVKKAGRLLSEKGARLVDRYGNCWEEEEGASG